MGSVPQSTDQVPQFAAATVALLAVVAGFSGCSDRPRLVSVSGTVRYRGEPVADADVAFITPAASRYAIAKTDARGRFALGTFAPGDGALAGTYRVTVSSMRGVSPPPSMDMARTKEESDAQLRWFAEYEAAVKAGRAGVPIRYSRQDTSPLEVTIGPTGGTCDLELTDD